MALGITTQGLRKEYASPPPLGQGLRPAKNGAAEAPHTIAALDGLTLDVRPGEIFGLLGPNGAGKSTTVGVLTTRIAPTAGRAWIGDLDISRHPVAARRLIGVVPQRPNLDFALTAREILTFHGAYFGMTAHERQSKAAALLDQFQLADRADQLPASFSGGMMQRLSIARAMVHTPAVLFLDEPGAGLDPQTRLLLTTAILDYNASGHTILLTTHNMDEAETLCHRVAIIDHGKVIALGTPRELRQRLSGEYVLGLYFSEPSTTLCDGLGKVAGVTQVRSAPDGRIDVHGDRGGAAVPEILEIAAAAGATLRDLTISQPSLEHVFLHLTGRSLRE